MPMQTNDVMGALRNSGVQLPGLSGIMSNPYFQNLMRNQKFRSFGNPTNGKQPPGGQQPPPNTGSGYMWSG